MVEHGIALRAIPLKVRETYEISHAAQIPDGHIMYLEEFKREMLVVERVPQNAGKFAFESSCGTSATVRFQGNAYYDSIKDAMDAILRTSEPKTKEFRIGQKVLIKHPPGVKSIYTPAWCEGWTGEIINLNACSVTVAFAIKESGQDTLRRYIDYQDIQVIQEQEP